MPFQPGVSGNPNGRPPGSGSVEKAFTQALNIAVKEAHAAGGDKLRAVADALVDKAMTGDVPAIKELADRIEGKVAVDANIKHGVDDALGSLLEKIAVNGRRIFDKP